MKWLWLSLAVFILDQGSKLAVAGMMQLYESIPVMPCLNLTYVHNPGAAFSFLSNAGGWQRWFFAGLAVIISIGLTVWLSTLQKQEVLLATALSLILGGAVGNLIDRLIYGYVIDFIDVYYRDWHWPAFNIADSAITLGIMLMVAETLGLGKSKKEMTTDS